MHSIMREKDHFVLSKLNTSFLGLTLVALVSMLSVCFGGDSDLPLGSHCDSDNQCGGELVCQYGRCRSECNFDHECPDGTFCVAVVDNPDVRVCTLPNESGLDPGECPSGLEPLDGVCLNTCSPELDDCGVNRQCIEGFCIEEGSCTSDIHCQFSCECRDGRCRPPAEYEDVPDYCIAGVDQPPGELVVTTVEDENDCDIGVPTIASCNPDGDLSLREALLLATVADGRAHITLAPSLPSREFHLDPANDELPPVPSQTHLDGGPWTPVSWNGMTIYGDGIGEVGLVIDGDSIVVSDVEVTGFPVGFRVSANSTAVSMFHVRSVDNDEGIVIEPGSSEITLGLGREVEGIEPHTVPFPEGYDGWDPNMVEFAWNVVVDSRIVGIRATDVTDLRISGTSVGYDNLAGPDSLSWSDGTGIILDNVRDALIGAQELEPEELESLSEWMSWTSEPLEDVTTATFYQTFVVVTNQSGGGLQIIGGGDITVQGVHVGGTAKWDLGEGNGSFGVQIRENTTPVTIGPSIAASGDEALLYTFIYATIAPAIEISQNDAAVHVRGTAIVEGWEPEPVPVVVPISENGAPISFHHTTIAYNGGYPDFIFEVQDSAGGPIDFVNNLFWGEDLTPMTILSGSTDVLSRAVFRGNAWIGSGSWCDGTCDTSDLNTNGWEVSATEVRGVVPKAETCSWLDRGVPLDFDVNGAMDDDFNGCGPDPGAFECMIPECISCDT